jgi:hypothetical protein
MENNYFLFDDVYGLYNYPGSAFLEEGVLHVFYCANREPFKIVDHLVHRAFDLGTGEAGEKTYVLAPSPKGAWDDVHDCDPSLVRADFTLGGERAHYLLAYLGCDTLNCRHNQVGLAYASSLLGPYQKFAGNPIVPFDGPDAYKYWGTGQPSLLSLNGQDEFLLVYSHGDRNRPGCGYVRFSLAKGRYTALESGEVGSEGLLLADHRDAVNNVDVALGPDGLYYMVRDIISPRDGRFPDFVSTSLEIARAASLKGPWTHLAFIGPRQTGYPRNHNACLVRDAYGHLPAGNDLAVLYTGNGTSKANDELSYVWSYRLHYFNLKNVRKP